MYETGCTCKLIKESIQDKALETQNKMKTVKKMPKKQTEHLSEDEANELRLGPFPLVTTNYPGNINENKTPPNPNSQTTSPIQPSTDTPNDYHDPTYFPPETPKYRREFQTTRIKPTVTRPLARILSQSHVEL